MIQRTGSRITTIGLLAALAGCGSSTATTDAGTTVTDGGPGNTDAGGQVTDAGGQVTDAGGTCTDSNPTATAATFDYVINTLAIDGMADIYSQPKTGFNVDGAYSPAHAPTTPPDCGHQDYFSAIDPDQNQGTCTTGMPNGGPSCHGGVDNQLPSLASTLMATGQDIGASLGAQIAQGKLSLLVRVSQVNGTPGPTLNDCNVTVQVFVGHPTGADCTTIFNGSSTFAVDNVSLNTPGDLTSAKYTFHGQILNGRLRITAGTMGMDNVFALPLPPIMGVVIMLNVHQLQLRLSMSQAAGVSGNLGGYLLKTETANAIRMAAPQFGSLVDSVIGGLVDVATGTPPSCGDTPATAANGGIGFGFGFTTVAATISPTTVTGAQPGTCGGPTSSGDGGIGGSDAGASTDAGH